METTILLMLQNNWLPPTTSNLIVNKKIYSALGDNFPIRTADSSLNDKNCEFLRFYPRFPRARACEIAVKQNDLILFQKLLRNGFAVREAGKLACRQGQEEMVIVLMTERPETIVFRSKKMTHDKTLVEVAAKNGHLSIVRFLLTETLNSEEKRRLGANILLAAAKHSKDVFIFVEKQLVHPDVNYFMSPTPTILQNVGDMDLLLLLLSQRQCLKTPGIWKAASKRGNKTMLLWATQNNVPWTTGFDNKSCVCVAQFGHLDILQWAYQKGHPITNLFLNAAAAAGHFEMVKWLFFINAPRHEELLGHAAKHSFEMFMLCIENGCSLDTYYYPWIDTPIVYEEAIRRRDYQLIGYMKKHDKFPLNIAAAIAAIGGHFDMMHRFIKEGSDLPTLDVVNLNCPDSLDIMNWLYEQGAGCDKSDLMNYILTACDLELLNWAADRKIYPGYRLNLYSQPKVDDEFRDTWNDLFEKYHLRSGA